MTPLEGFRRLLQEGDLALPTAWEPLPLELVLAGLDRHLASPVRGMGRLGGDRAELLVLAAGEAWTHERLWLRGEVVMAWDARPAKVLPLATVTAAPGQGDLATEAPEDGRLTWPSAGSPLPRRATAADALTCRGFPR